MIVTWRRRPRSAFPIETAAGDRLGLLDPIHYAAMRALDPDVDDLPRHGLASARRLIASSQLRRMMPLPGRMKRQ